MPTHNPPVQNYLEKNSELNTHISIEICGNVPEAVIIEIKLLEIALKHFATTADGLVRS